MSLLMGGGGNTQKPQYTGIQLQTSSSAIPIGEFWGKNRAAPNILWYSDFQSHKKKEQSSGKGAPQSFTYTYSASVILGMCNGVIDSVATMYRDKDVFPSAAGQGFSTFTGADGQAVWGYLTSAHPDQALPYSGVAYLAASNYDLGDSASLSNHSFEILARRANSANANGDARVDQVIDDILVQGYGANIGADSIGGGLLATSDATTTGDATLGTYCMAMGFGFSPFLSDQDSASSILARWLQMFNCAVYWTGYSMRFMSYCNEAVTGHGYVYVPVTNSVYVVGDREALRGDTAPFMVARADPADAKNSLRLEFKDRTNQYNPAFADWKDQGLIDQFGPLPDSNFSAPEICDAAMAGAMVSLMGQRSAYNQNNIKFSLPPSYVRCEPGDKLTLIDPAFGPFQVLLNTMEEGDDGTFACEGEETHAEVSSLSLGTYTPNPKDAGGINTAEHPDPVNDPTIFQPPVNLAQDQVWLAISGGNGTTSDPYWGGAVVYVSSDNTTFRNIGAVRGSSKQGVLTADLAAFTGTNPDTADTLSVSMAMSNDQLADVAPEDAAGAVSLCRLDTGEFLSYQDATLTGSMAYDLTTLYRGLYGTDSSGIAPSGTGFVALDEFVFKYTLPTDFLGVPLYFKFQSFNIWNQSYQDLADCDTYTFTPAAQTTLAPTSLSVVVSADGTISADWFPAIGAEAYLVELIAVA